MSKLPKPPGGERPCRGSINVSRWDTHTSSGAAMSRADRSALVTAISSTSDAPTRLSNDPPGETVPFQPFCAPGTVTAATLPGGLTIGT